MCPVGRIIADEKIFARSFRRQQQKKLACGAFIGCFIMLVSLCTVLKPYLGPPPIYFHVDTMNPIICNFSNSRSDVYEINGDVRIHGISSTIFIASNQDQNLSSWTIKPHARKFDPNAMRKVTDFKIKTEAADRIPHCNRILDIPAVLFSAGGHSGNHFHAFSDVLIPLFLTSHHFNRTIILLVTNQDSEWTSKYRVVLEKLSKYDVYDIDKENEVLCFSRTIIGLKSNKELGIDPSESINLSGMNFTKFLRSAYSLERESVSNDHTHETGRTRQPRMLIISRREGRKLTNTREIADMARGLGFDVVVKQMTGNLSLVAQLVNSVDVMVGMHGAGLTNMVFLPQNAILFQIIPFGLDHFSKLCFQWPAENMKLRYLEYKVSLNESSLLGKYSPDAEIYSDPPAILNNKGFDAFRSIYLDNQDSNLDLDGFRKTLLRALELVGT